MLLHYSDKSFDRKHCHGAVIMKILRHVASREHMFEELCEFKDGSSSG